MDPFFTSSDRTTIKEHKRCVLSIWKCFKIFLMYVDWCTKTPIEKWTIFKPRQNFVLPKSFISNSFFQQDFKLPTNTTIIVSLLFDFLIKMHEHIRLFTYLSLSRYSLSRLYHMIQIALIHTRIIVTWSSICYKTLYYLLQAI